MKKISLLKNTPISNVLIVAGDGGGAGYSCHKTGGGGGGSGYIGNLSNASMSSGIQYGNGKAKVSFGY